jgi:hypothetical protein
MKLVRCLVGGYPYVGRILRVYKVRYVAGSFQYSVDFDDEFFPLPLWYSGTIFEDYNKLKV